ncbi:MAG: hypothetical protein M1835_002643 [Candelina submexicana]|nr:MAG: hypothetical protein M1835_002643 [Candelina submexicana]
MCNIVVHTHSCGHHATIEPIDRCWAARRSGVDCDPALPAVFKPSVNLCKDCSLADQQGVIIDAGPSDQSISPAKLLFLRGQSLPSHLQRRETTDFNISLEREAKILPGPRNVGREHARQRTEEPAKKDLDVIRFEAEVGAVYASASAEEATTDGLASHAIITEAPLVVRNPEDGEVEGSSLVTDIIGEPEAEAQVVPRLDPKHSLGYLSDEGLRSAASSSLAPEFNENLVIKDVSAHGQSIISNVAVISGSASTPVKRPNLTDLTPVHGTQRVRNWLSAQGKVKATSLLDKSGYVPVSADTSRIKSPPLNQSPARRRRSSTLRSKKAGEGKWYPFVDEDAILKKSSSQSPGSLSALLSTQPLHPPIPSGEALVSSAPTLTARPDDITRSSSPLRLPSPSRALSSISTTISAQPTLNDENADPGPINSNLRATHRSLSPERLSTRPPLAEKTVPSLANLKLYNSVEWQGTLAPRFRQRGANQPRSPTKSTDANTELGHPSLKPTETTPQKDPSDSLPLRAENAVWERGSFGFGRFERSLTTDRLDDTWGLSQVGDPSAHSRPPVAALKMSLGLDTSLNQTVGPRLRDRHSTSTKEEAEGPLVATGTLPRSSEQSAIDPSPDPFLWLLPDRFRASGGLSGAEPPSAKRRCASPKEAAALAQPFGSDAQIHPEVLHLDEAMMMFPRRRRNRSAKGSERHVCWPVAGRTLASELLDAGESLSVFDGQDSP